MSRFASGDVDVAIVGFGPTGQGLAALLGAQGHRVQVFERHDDAYRLPRAIHFDAEAMRLFDRLGIVGDIQHEVRAPKSSSFMTGDGEVLFELAFDELSPAGWQGHYSFYQPVLEEALRGVVGRQASVSVAMGTTVEAIEQGDDHVVVRARDHDGDLHEVRAAYVIGADGANSVVREAAGIAWNDLEFSSPWVVADVRLHEGADTDHLPEASIILDAQRPYVAVINGRSYRRWEFLLTDDERDAGVDEARMWELLAPHISREDATIVRHAVYEFRSMLAETMQHGRVFLAGDAAHLMPPFAAQGMCCGLRDAACLAWKLDLVVRGVSGPELLDTYTAERLAQNEGAIRISIGNGMLITNLDPEFTRNRDDFLRDADELPSMDAPGLGGGVVRSDDPIAGELAVQGRVVRDGREGRFDEVMGPGFVLVCRSTDPAAVLGAERMRFLDAIGTRVATLAPGAAASVTDADGELSAWLEGQGLEAAISRPDFYAYGGAGGPEELAALVDALRDQLAYRKDA